MDEGGSTLWSGASESGRGRARLRSVITLRVYSSTIISAVCSCAHFDVGMLWQRTYFRSSLLKVHAVFVQLFRLAKVSHYRIIRVQFNAKILLRGAAAVPARKGHHYLLATCLPYPLRCYPVSSHLRRHWPDSVLTLTVKKSII